MTERKITHIPFSDVKLACNDIADFIASSTEKDLTVSLYGIPRGGLVPAVMVSHQLRKKGYSVKFITDPSEVKNNRATYILDEICDTGRTFKAFKTLHSVVNTVCMYRRASSSFTPTFSANVVDDDSWLEFCWETE